MSRVGFPSMDPPEPPPQSRFGIILVFMAIALALDVARKKPYTRRLW